MWPITIVWPSGGDFATSSTPTLPPAPGLFSITTGWPQAWASLSPIARARMSVLPPGVNGTTMRTGFDGNASAGPAARAVGAAAARAIAVAAPTKARRPRDGGASFTLRISGPPQALL